MSEYRDSVIQFLKWEIVGPERDDEVLDRSPLQRYTAGILFPSRLPHAEIEDEVRGQSAATPIESNGVAPELMTQEISESGSPEVADEPQRDDAAESELDDSVSLANAFRPSAIGISCLVESPTSDSTLRFTVAAATYQSGHAPPIAPGNDAVQAAPGPPVAGARQYDVYRRVPASIPPVTIALATGRLSREQTTLASGLELRVVARPQGPRMLLVSATVVNTNVSVDAAPRYDQCFFQVSLAIDALDGRRPFREYRLAYRQTGDDEERSLELLYRRRLAFAVGHGCAANWEQPQDDRSARVWTDTVPVAKVPPVVPTESRGDDSSMWFLSGADGQTSDRQIVDALEAMPREYGLWIDGLAAQVPALPERHRQRASEHIEECRRCRDRIALGVQALRSSSVALEAFKLANRAMLMQQVHYRRTTKPREPGSAWTPLPERYRPDDDRTGRWRRFQMAFILMNLSSLLPTERGHIPEPGRPSNQIDPRDVVDLIWFPTGGGKTEAYLGLTAYTLFLRRLLSPSADGCAVLMRYTLRLLTAQQFQRAASLISACELIRQSQPARLGASRITLGLWIGTHGKRGTRSQAREALNKWLDEGGDSPFLLLTCPWCGTRLDAQRPNHGYRPISSPPTVVFRCPEPHCPFSRESSPIPATVIDEDLYASPPTFLVSTVDKFAMLAWRPEAGPLLGLPSRRPPDLIIQDELHLISGPLGSMVGLYESLIELLCSRGGPRPKVVASTATIRRAADQCAAIFDRPTSIFPPSGLDVADSFFARENEDAAGRLYVGLLQTAASSSLTAQVRAASALLQAPMSMAPAGADDAERAARRDPYWTLIWYFNSLRELGGAASLVAADIPDHLRIIALRRGIAVAGGGAEQRRFIRREAELTSRVSSVPETLAQLFVPYPDEDALDVVLCTNMISVGVDVSRLGLMMINGQPKTTSEYIQASSRVGRSEPGLVVTVYNPSKPRDRSHYETFRAYHEAFYRFVEPTSVTPFSLPAQRRALHALLVAACRHLPRGVSSPDRFAGTEAAVGALRDWLSERCGHVDVEHRQALIDRFEALVAHWRSYLPREWGDFRPNPPTGRRLMYPAGALPRPNEDDDAWATPSSLRNVDVTCRGQLAGAYDVGPRQ